MKTIFYGASDDLIEIEGAISEEVDYNEIVNFKFSDGTIGTIDYDGDWNIDVTTEGGLFDKLIRGSDEIPHTDEEAANCPSYSDVLVLKEGIEWVQINGKLLNG